MLVILGVWILITLIIKAPIVVTVPKFWYEGITLGWLIIIRRESYSEALVAHEYIHFKQQKETLILPGYIMYVLEFLIKSAYYKSFTIGYRSISFEREASLMCGASSYLQVRKPFMFRHFIYITEQLLRIDKESPDSAYEELLKLKKGTVFIYNGIDKDLEQITNRLRKQYQGFKFKRLEKTTSLYNLYGENSFVVLENQLHTPKNRT